MTEEKRKIYQKLFTSTFQLSACTFGGGFVIIPLMRKKFVEELHWIEEQEMLDLTAIAQSSPGAIAVNASILVGYHVAGISGALVTLIGTVLPPLIIICDLLFLQGVSRQSDCQYGYDGNAGWCGGGDSGRGSYYDKGDSKRKASAACSHAGCLLCGCPIFSG